MRRLLEELVGTEGARILDDVGGAAAGLREADRAGLARTAVAMRGAELDQGGAVGPLETVAAVMRLGRVAFAGAGTPHAEDGASLDGAPGSARALGLAAPDLLDGAVRGGSWEAMAGARTRAMTWRRAEGARGALCKAVSSAASAAPSARAPTDRAAPRPHGPTARPPLQRAREPGRGDGGASAGKRRRTDSRGAGRGGGRALLQWTQGAQPCPRRPRVGRA